MRVLIRGAGDIATGIALRLYRSHMQVVMTDLPAPTAIRRTVCFSQAIVLGRTEVEGVAAVLAADAAEAESLLAQAKQLHDELEAIYNPHVDFARVYALANSHTFRLSHEN